MTNTVLTKLKVITIVIDQFRANESSITTISSTVSPISIIRAKDNLLTSIVALFINKDTRGYIESIDTNIEAIADCTSDIVSTRIDISISSEGVVVEQQHMVNTVLLTIVSNTVFTPTMSVRENIVTSISSNDIIVDNKPYILKFSCLERVVTYPLLNRTRRQLNFCSLTTGVGFITEEMIFLSGAQTYDSSVGDDYSFSVSTYKSDSFKVDNLGNELHYSVSSPYKFKSRTHVSDFMQAIYSKVIPIVTSVVAVNRLVMDSYVMAPLVFLRPAQVITYTYTKLTRLIASFHTSDSVIVPTTTITIDTTNPFTTIINTLKISSNHFYTSKMSIPFRSEGFTYGGNTFYSLSAFFNYFRHKYYSDIASYKILIATDKLNLYTADMVCLESHKVAFKSVEVSSNIMQSSTATWLTKDDFAYIYYENQFVFYDTASKLLYTYSFADITLTSKQYYNINSDILPNNIVLFLDKTYNIPYAMPINDAVDYKLTPLNETWNIVQVNSLKTITAETNAANAKQKYINELLVPIKTNITQILYRQGDLFIFAGYNGIEYSLYSLNVSMPSNLELLISYKGSKVIHFDYPYAYYSEYTDGFLPSSLYGRIVKLNITTLVADIRELPHYKYEVIESKELWQLLKDANSTYYLYREADKNKVINVSTRLSLATNVDIIDAILDTVFMYFITSTRVIYKLNLETFDLVIITTINTPILFLRLSTEVLCVVTRNETALCFESIQDIKWSYNPDDWVTPTNMQAGERLLPYNLYSGLYMKRTAPIKSLYNCIMVDRISNKLIHVEENVVDNYILYHSMSSKYNILAGKCQQQLGSVQSYSSINPSTYLFNCMEYNKSLVASVELNPDETFTLQLDNPDFPETLEAGFRIYEK